MPQAFSHWTMEGDGIDWAYMDEETGEERAAKLLVCDIQGCYVGERYEFQLNDPVIHSQAGESGCGDCGGCCCDSTPSSSPRRASGACLG